MYPAQVKQIMYIRQRWVFAVMCLFGMIHTYALRACLPITMTEMVLPIESDVFLDDSCPSNIAIRANTTSNVFGYSGRKYNWSEYTQGIILSSFYYGYIVTHIPGGLLAAKYGGKHVLGFGIFASALCTLLIPLIVSYSDSFGLIILRFLLGLGQGVVYPAVSTMLSQWAPPEERSRTVTFVYSGEILGTIYGNSAGGAILHHFGNWSSVFYLIGTTGVIWYTLFLLLCYNTPREHPFISREEVDFLNEKMSKHRHENPGPIPWSHVLKSKPLWAAATALFGFDWSLITILTYLPKYMSSVLKFSVAENGYLNSVVCICMWIGSITASWIVDLAIGREYISRTRARKTGAVLSLIGSSCFVVLASYAGCDRVLVTTLFAISMASLAIAYSSIVVNTLDLSPNYAGTLIAITNGISCGVSGSLSPYIISIFTPNQTLSEWRFVFWLLLTVSVSATAIFFSFGNAEVEYWNDPKNLVNTTLNDKGKIEKQVNVKDNVFCNSEV